MIPLRSPNRKPKSLIYYTSNCRLHIIKPQVARHPTLDRFMITMDNNSGRKLRNQKIPITQYQLISIWFREGWSNKDIHRGLTDKFGNKESASLRVIQNQTRDIKKKMSPWDRLKTNGYDAGLILEILFDLNKRTKGKNIQFTEDEAEWIIWVCTAAPNLPPYGVWVISQLYIFETTQDNPHFSQLDLFLGSKCWESFDMIIEYAEANLDTDLETGSDEQTSLILEVIAKLQDVIEEKEATLRDIEIQSASGDPCAIFALALYESAEEGFDEEPREYQYIISDDHLHQARENEELRRELDDKTITLFGSESADAVDWVKAEAKAQAQLEEMLEEEEAREEPTNPISNYLPDETAEIVNSLDS